MGTPFCAAVAQDALDVIRELVSLGAASVNARDSDEVPLIVCALQTRSTATAITLLALGADPNAKDKASGISGRTACPAPLTPRTRRSEYTNRLVAPATRLSIASACMPQDGLAALHHAARDDSVAAVSLLLEAGATIEIRDKVRRGYCCSAPVLPGFAACLSVFAGRRLHAHCGALCQMSQEGATPLLCCANPLCFIAFLKGGADPDAKFSVS